MRQVRYAALMSTLLLAALSSGNALAAFGGPSNEALLTNRDLWTKSQQSNAPAPEYTSRVRAILMSSRQAQQPITGAIAGLRLQIVDRLTSSDPVDAGQLQGIAQQIFALRKQLDQVDNAREVAVRAALTPAELAQVTQRHRQFVAINTERAALDNPEQYPESAYLFGDLFGDNMSASRGVLLSDDQIQRQQAIKDRYTGTFRSIQAQRLQIHHFLFDKLAGGPAVTAADLAPLQQQASVLKDQMDTQRLAMVIELRAVLTPAQLAKSAEMRSQVAAIRLQAADAVSAAQNATAAP